MLQISPSRSGAVIAAASAMALAFAGQAAADLPESPITLVVGVGAGGSTDVTTRAIASRIEQMGGPRFIIENRPGGGGVPAALYVKDSKPDGRTLFMASYAPFVIGRLMTSKPQFDPATDFKPITTLFNFPLLATVATNVEAKSIPDLIALSKKRKEGITNGSQGVGTAGHLLGEMFASATGANVLQVHYKGAAQAVLDLAAGRIDMMFVGTMPSRPHVQAGKLRPLAATSEKRVASYPDLPTFAELGYPQVNTSFVWFGAVAPAGTPDKTVASIREWFVKAVQDEKLKETIDAQGIELESSTPEAFAQRIADDFKQFAPIVRAAQKGK